MIIIALCVAGAFAYLIIAVAAYYVMRDRWPDEVWSDKELIVITYFWPLILPTVGLFLLAAFIWRKAWWLGAHLAVLIVGDSLKQKMLERNKRLDLEYGRPWTDPDDC